MWNTKRFLLLRRVFDVKKRNWHFTLSAPKEAEPAPDKPEVWTKHYLVPCCEMVKVTDKSKKVPEDIESPSVAIIGAGMAGLSAAVRLVQAGITDVKIIEAKSGPGGRISCSRVGKSTLEFGADCIEGACVANPIYNLAALESLLMRNQGSSKQYYLTTAGETFLDNATANKMMATILAEASGYFSRPDPGSDISLEEFMNTRIEMCLKGTTSRERQNTEIALSGLSNNIRGRFGEDLHLVSLKNYGSYIEIPGGQLCIPRGASSLISALMDEIHPAQICYERCVQNIRYTPISVDTPRALIRCCDGEEFLADYVICTASIGVLKAVCDLMFLPTLPSEKVEAIKSIGFGQITKIFMLYNKPFWTKGEKAKFLLAMSISDKTNREDWLKGITSIESLPGRQNILKVTVVGKEAHSVEQMKRHLVAEELTNFLRKVSGDKSLPYPEEVNVSNWSTDLNFLGARSYLGLGSNVKHQCALASPVPGIGEEGPPILLFAGEATSPGCHGTMHGARLSGIREAERIIDLTIELEGPPKRFDTSHNLSSEQL